MTDLHPTRRAPILDGRLSTAMELAGNSRIFADIGADHGRLSTVMLLQDSERQAIVADISASALEKAIQRIKRTGLADRTFFSVSDGLLALENARDVDGMYLDEAKGGFSFRNHGELLLLGSGGHRTGKDSRGWDDLRAFAKKHYPNAREKYCWATQDCMTLDGMPYIGQYSRRTPDLYVATGFNKWGMTSSMVAAMVLTDLVQGKENPYAGVFSPSRSILRPQLLVNGVEATANLIKPKKPRCPHLGCALKWNPYERSWDCSCHGSRFGEDGKLQNGPATGDLPNAPPDKGA